METKYETKYHSFCVTGRQWHLTARGRRLDERTDWVLLVTHALHMQFHGWSDACHLPHHPDLSSYVTWGKTSASSALCQRYVTDYAYTMVQKQNVRVDEWDSHNQRSMFWVFWVSLPTLVLSGASDAVASGPGIIQALSGAESTCHMITIQFTYPHIYIHTNIHKYFFCKVRYVYHKIASFLSILPMKEDVPVNTVHIKENNSNLVFHWVNEV